MSGVADLVCFARLVSFESYSTVRDSCRSDEKTGVVRDSGKWRENNHNVLKFPVGRSPDALQRLGPSAAKCPHPFGRWNLRPLLNTTVMIK